MFRVFFIPLTQSCVTSRTYCSLYCRTTGGAIDAPAVRFEFPVQPVASRPISPAPATPGKMSIDTLSPTPPPPRPVLRLTLVPYCVAPHRTVQLVNPMFASRLSVSDIVGDIR